MVGKSKESVWVLFKKFAPHLNGLQKRTESIGGGPVEREEVIAQYWVKVCPVLGEGWQQPHATSRAVRQPTQGKAYTTASGYNEFSAVNTCILPHCIQVRAFLQLGMLLLMSLWI